MLKNSEWTEKNMDEGYSRADRSGRLWKGKTNCGVKKELETQSCQPSLRL